MTGFRLGVDFGTSTTIAMLRRPDGRVQPLLFDGSPLLSSAVLLGPDGRLHTGRDAAHLARSAPERLEPNPKRRIDDTSVLLGDVEIPVRDLVAAVLQRVATEAARVAGPVSAVTLTHPANWGTGRRAVLLDAARQAGFADVGLVTEPVAAATYLASTRGGELPVGACVVVYDLGAGTCDVTVLRRAAHGFEPVASDGLNDVGGLDVDATVVAFLQATYGTLWDGAATRRQLWDDVRSAKEMLSRASGTVVMVPALGKEVPLGREQLEGLARPVLRQTVSMTRALLTEAGVAPSAIAGLFLVGGSSRIPLVATMLHESIGIAPVVAEQPELVVAEGALYANGAQAGAPAAGTPTAGMIVSGPPAYGPTSAPPATGRPTSGPPVPGSPAGPYSTGAYGTGSYTSAMPHSAIPESTLAGGMRPAPMPVSASPFASAPVSAVPRPLPPAPGRPNIPGAPGAGWAAPPPQRRRSRAPIVVAVVALSVVLLAVVTTVGYVLTQRANDPGGDPVGTSGTSGATRKAGAPGKYDLTKLPENLCGTIDTGPISGLYEQTVGDPTPSRNLNTFAGTASCTISRIHKSGVETTSASVMLMATVYADTSSSAAVGKQMYDSAKLNGAVTDVKGVGEQAFTYIDKQAGTQTVTFIGLDSNLVCMFNLIPSPGPGKSFTDAQITDLQNRLVQVAKAAFPKTAAAIK